MLSFLKTIDPSETNPIFFCVSCLYSHRNSNIHDCPFPEDAQGIAIAAQLATCDVYEELKAYKRSHGRHPKLEQIITASLNSNSLKSWITKSYDLIIPICGSLARNYTQKGGFTVRLAEILQQKISGKLSTDLFKSLSLDRKSQGQTLGLGRFEHDISFEWAGANLAHKSILVVEDFVTSGVTLRAALKTLRNHSGRNIDVWALGLLPRTPERVSDLHAFIKTSPWPTHFRKTP